MKRSLTRRFRRSLLRCPQGSFVESQAIFDLPEYLTARVGAWSPAGAVEVLPGRIWRRDLSCDEVEVTCLIRSEETALVRGVLTVQQWKDQLDLLASNPSLLGLLSRNGTGGIEILHDADHPALAYLESLACIRGFLALSLAVSFADCPRYLWALQRSLTGDLFLVLQVQCCLGGPLRQQVRHLAARLVDLARFLGGGVRFQPVPHPMLWPMHTPVQFGARPTTDSCAHAVRG